MTTVNNAPVLTGKKAVLGAGKEDFTYTINVKGFTGLLAGFTDLNGDTLSVANLTANNGTLIFNASKNIWTFTPEANFNGLVTLNYDVVDGKGGITHATQTFTIGAVNDAPTDINVVATNVNGASSLGTSIATISTTDIDNTTGFTYALVGGTGDADNAIFSIEGNQLKINSATVPLKETYTIRLQSTDTGGLSYQKIVTLSNAGFKIAAPIPPAQGGFTTGDANGDGTIDQNQTSVASIQASSKGVWATFQADSTLGDTGIEIQNLSLLPFSGKLPGFAMTPYGAFSYDIKLPSSTASLPQSVTMTLYLSGNWSLTSSGYLNSTTGDVVNGIWKMDTESVWHDIATTKFIQDGKLVMTYTLTDGDPLTDSDNVQNGTIVDPIVVGQNFAAPTLSWNDTGIQGDSLTNDGTITVGGLLNGSQWYYRVNDSDWQLGNGNSFLLSGDGNKDIRVQQVDTNGNRSVEANLTISLDTTGPNSPTVWTHGSRTNSAFVGVTGLETGATWQYKLSQQDEWHTGEGNNFSVPGDGAWTVMVRQTDTAGNISNINGTSFFLDKTAPSFSYSYVPGYNETVWHDQLFGGYWDDDGPRHSGFYVVNASDMSGIFDATFTADDITHDMGHSHPWYGYDLGPNTFVYVTDTQPSSFNIAVVDNFFNVSSTGIVPGVPKLSLVNDTGAKDDISQDGRVLVDGLMSGATWQYKVNDSDWQTGIGNSFNLTGDGAKNVQVKQISPQSVPSALANFSFQIDTASPSSAPAVSWTDTGAQDGVFTKNGTIKVSNLEPGATWQYSVNGSEWQQGWGKSVTLTGDGEKNVLIRQVDGAGNFSGNASISFTLDTKAPSNPRISHQIFDFNYVTTQSTVGVDLEPGASFQYRSASDFQTSIIGYTNTGTPIKDYIETWHNGTGNSFQLTDEGKKIIFVRQIDAAGNISTSTASAFTFLSESNLNALSNQLTPDEGPYFNINDPLGTFMADLKWHKAQDPVTWGTIDVIGGIITLVTGSALFGAITGAAAIAYGIYSIVDGAKTLLNLPAGISGEPIFLGLTHPNKTTGDVISITVNNLPSDWSLNEGGRQSDGTWLVKTSDPSSLTVTSPVGYVGALTLDVSMTWKQGDEVPETKSIISNVEVYASGTPIFAWSGDDNLTGSSAADLFVISQPAGNIQIFNFDPLADKIDLLRLAGLASIEDLQQRLSIDENGNAIIQLADDKLITFIGIHPNSLNTHNFVFNETPTVHNSEIMSIEAGALMPLSGVIDNSGSIELHSADKFSYFQLVGDGISLQGGGRVVLSDSDWNVVFGTSADAKFINIDNIISGAGNLGGSQMLMDNRGIISADGTHALMIDTGANEVINTGTLESTGSGGLYVNSSLLNQGLLLADGGDITLMGAVSGNGSATVNGIATIEFAAESSTNISFADTATATLKLGDSAHFSGTLSGWNNDDSLYLWDIIGDTATLDYAAETGVLSVTDGAHTAQITLIGLYDASLFNLATDAATGGAVIQFA